MMDNKHATARAWLVHFYTALGLVAAFAAFLALLDGNARLFFLWQGAALIIDATDGSLARRWDVRRWTPAFNGRRLDDIVDYLNYTFIPMLFAYRFGLVSGPGIAVVPIVLIASAYGFSQEQAKTDDGYFTGFPSYWNLLVFYLYLLDLQPWVSALVLAIFALLVFTPVKYITWKSPVLRRATLLLSLAWGLSLAGILLGMESVPQWAVWLSLLYPAYHLGLSLFLSISQSQEPIPEQIRKEPS